MNQLNVPIQNIIEAQIQEIQRLTMENIQLKAALSYLMSPKPEETSQEEVVS